MRRASDPILYFGGLRFALSGRRFLEVAGVALEIIGYVEVLRV